MTGNKFDTNKDISDLNGNVAHPPHLQVYIITGDTAGIGFGITAHILQHNAAKIYLLSAEGGACVEDAIEGLKKYGDTGKVGWVHCDLKNLKKTDESCEETGGSGEDRCCEFLGKFRLG